MKKLLLIIFIITYQVNIYSQQTEKFIEVSEKKGIYPQYTEIFIGDKIIFNTISEKHIIVFPNHEFISPKILNSNSSQFSLKLFEEDEYDFICKLHDNEFGTIKTISKEKVELNSFKAEFQKDKIFIKWQTLTEFNNLGFDLERKIENKNDWEVINFIPGNNIKGMVSDYEYLDNDILENEKYFYRLKQKSYNGDIIYSNEIVVSTSEKGNYHLFQNYPNPFNPVTKISYSLPRAGHVNLRVYNALGNQVDMLLDEEQNSGFHEIYFDGSDLPTGVYYLQLTSNGYKQIIKMILLR